MKTQKKVIVRNLRLSDCIRNFLLEMEISNLAPGSVHNSGLTLGEMAEFGEQAGWSESLVDLDRDRVLEFLVHLKSRPSRDSRRRPVLDADGRPRSIGDAYYRTCYRRLSAFFNWCLKHDYIEVDPLRNMPVPRVAKRVVPTVSEDDFKRLLLVTDPGLYKTGCWHFLGVRDQALLWLFFDTPGRNGEIGGLRTDQVNLKERRIMVEGKGRKERYMYLGAVTVRALGRYQVLRDSLAQATDCWWVNSVGGAMSADWVYSGLKRIARRAGVEGLHPHRFRHTFSIAMIEGGVPLPTLEVMGGWEKIPDTYLATLGDKAARAAHKMVSPADRLAGRK